MSPRVATLTCASIQSQGPSDLVRMVAARFSASEQGCDDGAPTHSTVSNNPYCRYGAPMRLKMTSLLTLIKTSLLNQIKGGLYATQT